MIRLFVALDTNILVYACNRGSEWHGGAQRCLGALAATELPWALPWPYVHEFLAVATNPRIFAAADALPQALDQVEAWMEAPGLRLLGEWQEHWPTLRQLLLQGKLRGGAVHDARLAAICLEHGVQELWTADRDFSKIGGLRVRNPLLGS